MMDWSTDDCPDYYKRLYPGTWATRWQEVIDRRNVVRRDGVGEFLIQYYPDVIRRIFGYTVTRASTVENRVRTMINNWNQEYHSMPKLPSVILNKLGLTQTQTQFTNFLGTP